MPYLEVVENPRRRRRRRSHRSRRHHYSRAQLAAGFGGRGRMSTGRRHYRRRRNPSWLAALENPRRRRYGRRRHHRRRYYARRNPSLFGLTGNISIMDGVWVATGSIGSTMLPGLVRRFWPGLPSTGIWTYVNRLGGAFVTSMAVKMLTKNRRAVGLVWAGAISFLLVDLFRDYVAPRIGLSGLGLEDEFVLTREIQDALPGGVSGFSVKPYPVGMAGYRWAPEGWNPALVA